LIFIGTHNGSIYCLNQSDGVIRWDKQLTKPVLSSAAVLKDKVFLGSSDKKVYCFECNTGTKAWEFETSDRIWSSPTIAENDMVLFLGSLDSHIYGLDILTGNQTWKFPTMNIIDYLFIFERFRFMLISKISKVTTFVNCCIHY